MEKNISFRSGSIWLNVFTTESGKHLATINRSYKKDGAWKTTPFFDIKNGDIDDIKKVIQQYEENLHEEVVVQ